MQGGVSWDAREKVAQTHYLRSLQPDNELDEDVV